MRQSSPDDRVTGRLRRRGSPRRLFRWRPELLAASLALALIAGVRAVPAEARDLLILIVGSEVRRGELLSCDATACWLDSAAIPRQSIVMIGLADPPLPPPTVRSPLQDEIHLRGGSVHPGLLVSLDARRVTAERTFDRREVRWIYLRYVPAPGGVAREPSKGGGEREEDGACGFWVGMLRQRADFRRTTTYNQLRRTVRTVYAARFRETARARARPGPRRSGPGRSGPRAHA